MKNAFESLPESHQRREKIDVLMISERSMWPEDQGFRVHGCQMMKALSKQGIRAKIASMETTEDAPDWLSKMMVPWKNPSESDKQLFFENWGGRFSKLRQKIVDHQGIDTETLPGAIRLIRHYQPKVVIALGLHGSIMLKGLQQTFPRVKMIWYAADEPVSFHLSCLKYEGLKQWRMRLRNIALFGCIERLFSKGLDGAIAVSPLDAKRLRLIGGIKSCAVIRNGVDLEKYDITPQGDMKRSLVFWGRMDFEPNVDAVCWFAKEVWPKLTKRSPQAVFKIVGKNPSAEVQALAKIKGIEVTGEVDDVRAYARDASVTILPMRCGAGIKNKLLEAAAMGLTIVASEHTIKGLEISRFEKPMMIAKKPHDWVETIWALWNNPVGQSKLRLEARQWVERRHNWRDAAIQLIDYVNEMLPLDERLSSCSTRSLHIHEQNVNTKRNAA